MTNSEQSMDGLNELLNERGRYETWLAQLDARRGQAPAHVLERVRADYSSRLETVTSHLRGRAVELEQTVATLRRRVEGLVRDEEQRRDERAETEIRAGVGEFGEEEARSAIAASDEAIRTLVGERESVSAELARLEGILIQIVPPPPAPAVPTAVPALESLDRHVPIAAQAAAAHAPPRVATPNPIDELEFLRSVVSSPETNDVVLSGQAPAQPDFLPPPLLAAPRRQVTPLSTAIPVPRTGSAQPAGGPGALTPNAVPSFLKDVPTEQVKTLKCAECGTMNSPTEWYCERCGGELAAM
ncbi:MAG: hypothetical protein ACT4OZ_09445 [Gemmatimonadota bacterium]